jgi:hypothetical protein
MEDGAVGPGYYDPSINLVRKKPPSCGWSNYRTQRRSNVQGHLLQNPGPEKYNQQQTSIGMKMMKNII